MKMSILKKRKNLILFIILTFLRSVFMGMMKFYLWSYLKEIRTLQEITGYASLGGIIAYLVGGTLAYAFTKKKIIFRSALFCIFFLLIGFIFHYQPFFLFAFLLSSIGFFYSLWLTIKSVILSIEILSSGLSDTFINGIANICILVGFLLGSYLGFVAYAHQGNRGFFWLILILAICAFLSLFFTYDKIFHKEPFFEKFKKSIPNILFVTEKYFWILVPIGILRSVGMVMGQKMLEMGIKNFDKIPSASVFILMIFFIGGMIGNLISAFIKTNKKLISLVFIVITGRSVILFPHFMNTHENYFFLKMYSFAIGVFSGIAINILEGKYFYRIGEDQNKEYGAAAYGIISSILMFFIMIISDLLTIGFSHKLAYFFCGIIILLNALFIEKIYETNK